jgi:ubiquinone/menaquinone biosynthesis C-methylase UbiE
MFSAFWQVGGAIERVFVRHGQDHMRSRSNGATVVCMTHHTHHHPSPHSHAAMFEDDRMAAILEAEGELAVGLTDQAVARCADLFDVDRIDVQRVVDLGCGPGVAATQLAEMFNQATVVGVDSSLVMLERAADRAARRGVSRRVELRSLDLNGDLRVLDTFDLVWTAMALHHTANEQEALSNFAALLRNHGLLCLIERADPIVVRPAHDLGRPGIWDRVEGAQSRWFKHARVSLPGAANVASYVGMLEHAGLELLDTRTLTDTVTSPPVRVLQPTIHRYVRAALRNLPDLLDPADIEALADADRRIADVAWGDAIVASSRTLCIARPAGRRS